MAISRVNKDVLTDTISVQHSSGLDVKHASLTNILEDELEELKIVPASSSLARDDDVEVELRFRGFEIKTVKLTLGDGKKKRANSWVKIDAC